MNEEKRIITVGGGTGSNENKRINLVMLLLSLQGAHAAMTMPGPKKTVFKNPTKPVVVKPDQTSLIENAAKKRLKKRQIRKLQWQGK